jgi:esterase
MTNAARVPAIVLMLLVAACQSATRPALDLPEGVKTLPANGYPMAYLERGNGPTVVLVHGAFNDYRYWTPQFSSLPGKHRLVAVSLRHHYPEAWNGKGDDYSLDLHAQDVAAFIERLGAGPVFLVAHSRGGAVALSAVKLRPDLVTKLVLMEPALFALLPKPSGTPQPDPRTARAKAAAALFERGDIEGGLEFYIDAVFGAGSWKRRSEEVRQFTRDSAWTVVAMAQDTDTVTCEDLRRINIPVLLVGSDKGPRIFASVLNEAEKCLPSASRITIPNAAHPMNRDNPVAFDQALADFLR